MCAGLCIQGHVDFSYEVSRSLAASQGVLLLVDAQQVSKPVTVPHKLLITVYECTSPHTTSTEDKTISCTEHWALLIYMGDCTHVCVLCHCHMQGVQAQTVANFLLSFEANLSIIPVINKVRGRVYIRTCISIKFYSYSRRGYFPIVQIDLPLADVDRVLEQLQNAFGFSAEEALKVYSLYIQVYCL